MFVSVLLLIFTSLDEPSPFPVMDMLSAFAPGTKPIVVIAKLAIVSRNLFKIEFFMVEYYSLRDCFARRFGRSRNDRELLGQG